MLAWNSDQDTRPMKVLILEDDTHGRAGLQADIKSDSNLTVVGSCADVESALRCVREKSPDVAVIDLRISGVDDAGLQAIGQMKEIRPELRFVVNSAYLTVPRFYAAIKAGVRIIVQKATPGPPMCTLVRLAARGAGYYDPALVRQTESIYEAMSNHMSPTDGSEKCRLTQREREVLRHVQLGEDNNVIAEALCISKWTVKNHVSSILGKLGAASRQEAAVKGIASSESTLEDSPARTSPQK